MAMLYAAYFDESYGNNPASVKSSDAFAVAGWVSTVDKWEKLETEWDRVLACFGVKEFHMSHFEAGYGEYASWKEDTARRLEFITSLTNIAKACVRFGVCASTERTPFREIVVPHVTPEFDFYCEPYVLCLQGCLEMIVDRASWLGVTPLERVACIVDENHGIRGGIDSYYHRMIRYKNWKDVFRGLTSESSFYLPPLQAADYIAYETYKHATNHLMASGMKHRRRSLESLLGTQVIDGGHWGPQELRAFADRMREGGP